MPPWLGATSLLDNVTERDVMAAIEALPGRKTVVIIAHRLSTMRRCDRIVLMRHGWIATMGNWVDLMRDSAEFRALAAEPESS